VSSVYDAVVQLLKESNAYILDATEKEKVGRTMIENGHLNSAIVGQSAFGLPRWQELMYRKTQKC
jgi:acetaldehyde dehydrogenase/alcohol dehydrogenase